MRQSVPASTVGKEEGRDSFAGEDLGNRNITKCMAAGNELQWSLDERDADKRKREKRTVVELRISGQH
jgi:hypothetical protein